jgi:hypothetical protein
MNQNSNVVALRQPDEIDAPHFSQYAWFFLGDLRGQLPLRRSADLGRHGTLP